MIVFPVDNMPNLKQDWHSALLICIADIAMLICFTYFAKHSSYSWKTKVVKRAN